LASTATNQQRALVTATPTTTPTPVAPPHTVLIVPSLAWIPIVS